MSSEDDQVARLKMLVALVQVLTAIDLDSDLEFCFDWMICGWKGKINSPVLYVPRLGSLERHFVDEHALVGLITLRLLAVVLAIRSCTKAEAERHVR